jgi:hypothetical protein
MKPSLRVRLPFYYWAFRRWLHCKAYGHDWRLHIQNSWYVCAWCMKWKPFQEVSKP